MYTRCPDCKTYFRVTAENLRVANGEVCCGACETEFNALASLADEVPDELIDNHGRDAIPDDITNDNDREETDFDEPVSEDESEIYGEIIVLESGPDDADPESSYDDHEASDTDYNDASEDLEESEPVVAGHLQDIEREFRNIAVDESGESSEDFHRWLAGDLETDGTLETEPKPAFRGWLVAATILTFSLLGQLLHYNRDSLAADSTYGGTVRGFYSRLGLTLYPEWELKSFEVRGTEAVAGDSTSSALNILANILVVSDQPVGMPMIRVVLHDRWSATVASGIFQPKEYLSVQDARPTVLEPGTTLPIKISVADPGSEARGYVVDICLPRRLTGLQCQLARDPFRQ